MSALQFLLSYFIRISEKKFFAYFPYSRDFLSLRRMKEQRKNLSLFITGAPRAGFFKKSKRGRLKVKGDGSCLTKKVKGDGSYLTFICLPFHRKRFPSPVKGRQEEGKLNIEPTKIISNHSNQVRMCRPLIPNSALRIPH